MAKNIMPERAVSLVTGLEDGTEDEILEAWQVLVDIGLAWSLEGSIGRQAAALIEEGLIHA